MSKIETFEDLIVWQKAHKLVLNIYQITKKYPFEEKFSLVSQMRRAAISIAANIAEGFKKRGIKNKINFYNISQGSGEELKYYTILSKDLGYIQNSTAIINSINEVSRMLNRLMQIKEK